jgi:sarcosine oxidase, subunit gamma
MLDAAGVILRSPLGEHFAQLSAPGERERAGIRVAEWAHLGCLVLRGRADDSAFHVAVQGVLGMALPRQPSTFIAAAHSIALWISPDEWWLLLPRERRDATLAALHGATTGLFAQVLDNSGSLACLHLAGPQHVTPLRHLSPYDFESLGIGGCVSTVFPKASVTVLRGDDDGVLLLFRRSFADWIWRLVERSAEPYGLARCAPSDLAAPGFAALQAGS